MTDPIFILAVLGANVVIAELLARFTWARHLGTTLLVMILTAVVANLGLIPTTTQKAPIYDGILTYVTPLAIFWLLLRVNLRDVLKAGLPMIALFLIGSFATVVGVVLAMWLVNGSETMGESYRAIGGVFVGTYTGGGVNFNALALHYGLNKQVGVYGGITAVDNILTTIWMAATIALPKLLFHIWPRPKFGLSDDSDQNNIEPEEGEDDTESVHPINLGILLALGAGSMWISDLAAARIDDWLSINLPSIIILTTIALVLAQIPFIQKQNGSQVLGLFAMYIFLAAIAALCDLAALREIGARRHAVHIRFTGDRDQRADHLRRRRLVSHRRQRRRHRLAGQHRRRNNRPGRGQKPGPPRPRPAGRAGRLARLRDRNLPGLRRRRVPAVTEKGT